MLRTSRNRQLELLEREGAAVHHDPVKVWHRIRRVTVPVVAGAHVLVAGARRALLQFADPLVYTPGDNRTTLHPAANRKPNYE